MVAEGLGGAPRMLAWCQEDKKNEAVFWSQIYPKLIPKDINANVVLRSWTEALARLGSNPTHG